MFYNNTLAVVNGTVSYVKFTLDYFNNKKILFSVFIFSFDFQRKRHV